MTIEEQKTQGMTNPKPSFGLMAIAKLLLKFGVACVCDERGMPYNRVGGNERWEKQGDENLKGLVCFKFLFPCCGLP